MDAANVPPFQTPSDSLRCANRAQEDVRNRPSRLLFNGSVFRWSAELLRRFLDQFDQLVVIFKLDCLASRGLIQRVNQFLEMSH